MLIAKHIANASILQTYHSTKFGQTITQLEDWINFKPNINDKMIQTLLCTCLSLILIEFIMSSMQV